MGYVIYNTKLFKIGPVLWIKNPIFYTVEAIFTTFLRRQPRL
jgi:hypothetical protein